MPNPLYLGTAYQPTAYAFQVPEYFGDLHVITKRFVEVAHVHNVEVHAWTINQTEDMERMLELGVDGMFTDYPDRLLDVLGRG